MPLAAPPALSHSIQRTVGPLPHDLKGRAVTFPSASGATLHGWLLEGSPGNGAILLMHGVRASRLDMLERARFLVAAGYSVM